MMTIEVDKMPQNSFLALLGRKPIGRGPITLKCGDEEVVKEVTKVTNSIVKKCPTVQAAHPHLENNTTTILHW